MTNSIPPFSAHSPSCLKTSCRFVQKPGTDTPCRKPSRPHTTDTAPSALLGSRHWPPIYATSPGSIIRVFLLMHYPPRSVRRRWRRATTSWCAMARARWLSAWRPPGTIFALGGRRRPCTTRPLSSVSRRRAPPCVWRPL